MADIKWIKITTDMFDNRKIKHLRKMPEGNNIVLIWVMLLTMAGRCNASGMIFLTENIPYTTKMLANELDFEESTVQLALTVLEQLGMVSTDGFLTITGWEEHQNVEGMDKIREQTRERVARHREKLKALPPSNVTCNVTVTDCNATDKNKNRKEKKEIENNITPPLSPSGERELQEEILDGLSLELHEAVQEWLQYKKEKRQNYKPTGLKRFLKQIRQQSESLGEEAVINCIYNSITSNYMGITWRVDTQRKKESFSILDL